MRVLVADDDALIRRLLLALLKKLGHEVEVAEEGNAAWDVLACPDPPAIAILDWVMPGVNGVDLCRKLRALDVKSRTYVILLSAKSDRADVIAGLDAGADDYLVKPFDPMSLLARLRVAQRILSYQLELQKHIADMEMLLQRYDLRGEMFGKQGRLGSSAGISGPGSNVSSPLLEEERVGAMLVQAMTDVGLGGAEAELLTIDQITDESAFTAWTPIVLVQDSVWVDLLLEADDASAAALFESLLGRVPISERELLNFLAETFNLVGTALKTALLNSGGVVLMPMISRAMRSGSLHIKTSAQVGTSYHRLSFPGAKLQLKVLRHSAPIVSKSLGQLHELDVIADNLASPSAAEVTLLNRGVVLNARYIEKLAELVRPHGGEFRVPVIQPSRLAEFFSLGRVRQAAEKLS